MTYLTQTVNTVELSVHVRVKPLFCNTRSCPIGRNSSPSQFTLSLINLTRSLPSPPNSVLSIATLSAPKLIYITHTHIYIYVREQDFLSAYLANLVPESLSRFTSGTQFRRETQLVQVIPYESVRFSDNVRIRQPASTGLSNNPTVNTAHTRAAA